MSTAAAGLDRRRFIALFTAVMLPMLLARTERAAAAPFLPLELLRLRPVRASAATAVCMAGALFALVFLLPLYVQVAGQLPRYGLALATFAIGLLALIEPGLHSTALLCGLAGAGLGTVMPNAQVIVQLSAGSGRLGAAAATVSLARAVGAAMGTVLFSTLFFALLYGVSPATSPVETLALPSFARVLHAGPYGFGALALWLAVGTWRAGKIEPLALKDVPVGEGAQLPS